MTSPLPFALAVVGTLLPLLAVSAAGPWPGRRGGREDAFALSVALMSGLVSGCIGVLLRESRRWGAFVALGMASGTAFGVLVAAVLDGFTFAGWPPLVALVAVACAGVLVAFAAWVFGEHRRLLAARPGSLLAQLGRARVGLTAATVVVVGAWVTGHVGRPSLRGLVVVALAVLVSAALVVDDRRRIRHLRAVVARAGVPVPHDEEAITSVDLGVGDERWLFRDGPGDVAPADPYRSESRGLRAVAGSLRLAVRRARQVAIADAAQLGVSVVLLIHLALGVDLTPRELAVAPHLGPATTAPALEVVPPLRTGSWYPGQEPLLVDIDGDGVEDVVSLRWDASNESRALFVAAHDGATLRPRWSTEPIPSQWMSHRTHLIRVDDVLFLTDSERKVHVLELSSGEPRSGPVVVDSESTPCRAPGQEQGVWFETRDRGGVLVDRQGKTVRAGKPADCRPVVRTPAPLGVWDPTCRARLLASDRTLSGASLHRSGEVGLAFFTAGEERRAYGYDPATCKLRWREPLAYDGATLHHDPHVRHALTDTRLFTLQQLDSGAWQLGVRDAVSGALHWHRALPRAERGSYLQEIFLGDERVYVARSWRLEVYRQHDGEHLGSL